MHNQNNFGDLEAFLAIRESALFHGAAQAQALVSRRSHQDMWSVTALKSAILTTASRSERSA